MPNQDAIKNWNDQYSASRDWQARNEKAWQEAAAQCRDEAEQDRGPEHPESPPEEAPCAPVF